MKSNTNTGLGKDDSSLKESAFSEGSNIKICGRNFASTAPHCQNN